jgi:hypothetical protein
MVRARKAPIERRGTAYRMNLDSEERELVHRLMGELRGLLGSPQPDERLRRLYPSAYHQEVDRNKDEEFQRLMHDDLLASRLKSLDIIDEFMGAARGDRADLTEAQLMAFLQALNSVRLVLGTMLDLSEDHDIDDITDNDPLVGEYHLYNFLSWLLDAAVRAAHV